MQGAEETAGRRPERARLRDFVPAAALLVLSAGATAAAAMAPGAAGEPVAAVFAPWTGPEHALRAVAAADGAAVRAGAFDNVVIAVSDDPGFRDRLRAAGAWLLLDPKALAACLGPAGPKVAYN